MQSDDDILDPRDAFHPQSPLWGAMPCERPVVLRRCGVSIEREYMRLRHAAVWLLNDLLASLDDETPALDAIRASHIHRMQRLVKGLGQVSEEWEADGDERK